MGSWVELINEAKEWVSMPTQAMYLSVGDDDKYRIVVREPGEYLALFMGFEHFPATMYQHENITRTTAKVFECKHYGHNGSKWWTKHPGTEHILVIPRKLVRIGLVKGYSYITACILVGESETHPDGRVYTILNVSGGTSGGGKGWWDSLPGWTATRMNHPMIDLEALAEVAVRVPEWEGYRYPEEIRAEFYAENKGKWIVVSATGDWHENVPEGMTGVTACINGHEATREERDHCRCFLVPHEEYRIMPGFVIDLERHQEVEYIR